MFESMKSEKLKANQMGLHPKDLIGHARRRERGERSG